MVVVMIGLWLLIASQGGGDKRARALRAWEARQAKLAERAPDGAAAAAAGG
jgi:hypothetical protein